MRLEKLTKKQESKLKTYREKWLKIGLDTRRADRKKAQRYAVDAYKAAGLEAPKIFIWLDSPYQGAIAAAMLSDSKFGPSVSDQVSDQVWFQMRDQVSDQVRAQVWSQVRAQVSDQVVPQVLDQVWDQVRDKVWDQVRAQVGDQMRDQVRDKVRAQVGDQVRDQVWTELRAQVGDQVYRCGYGLHDANWLGFYDFFLKECKLVSCKKLEPMMKLATECGWWWPFKGAVVFTEKPKEIYRNARFQLHNFDGPALLYADGFALYRMNGVRVTKELAEMPKEKITKQMITKEVNADVRREIIRKLGSERLAQVLDYKVIDSFEGYELVSFDIGDGRTRPFLRMINPSMDGVIHIEGVRPGITTVKDAICYRNGLGSYEAPVALS